MFVARQTPAPAATLDMRVELATAQPEDAAALAALHTATNEKLTSLHGSGPWSGRTTEKGMRFVMRHSRVFVTRRQNKIIAMLTLGTKKPWAIDRKYFSQCTRPIYLTAMAVAPEFQGQGIGRRCVDAAIKIVKDWPADAIFLDAYDAAAGAGGFYRRCGFCEVGRATYRGTPLIYFEMLLQASLSRAEKISGQSGKRQTPRQSR